MLEPYPFQKEGIEKLAPWSSGLCADDMGLGKTVQAVLIDKHKRANAIATVTSISVPPWLPTLVVCPTGLVSSWQNHFALWNPKLRVCAINRRPTVQPKTSREEFLAAVKSRKYDVYIIHWEGLRLAPELQKTQWFNVIADEVHRIKNRKAQQSVALKKLRATNKLGLSGTPADNRPDDFWSVLNWLWPKKFGSYWRFYAYFVLEKYHDELAMHCGCEHPHKRAYREITGTANEQELLSQFKHAYVRRLKEEVLKDLPPKYYTTIEVDLHPQQRRTYDEMRRRMLAWVGQQEDQPVAAPIVVAQLTRLQQFACAYAQLETVTLKSGESKTLLRLTEPSSKIDACVELIEDHPNVSFVVFAQSKQVINLLAQRLSSKRIPTGVYTGDTSSADRDRIVHEFQSGHLRVFAGTIAAGGEGITLTRASTVVFLDRAWSPSKNRQAEDRLHRIGQEGAVQVVDIVARDTLDAGRNQKIQLKWTWIKQILGDKVEVVNE